MATAMLEGRVRARVAGARAFCLPRAACRPRCASSSLRPTPARSSPSTRRRRARPRTGVRRRRPARRASGRAPDVPLRRRRRGRPAPLRPARVPRGRPVHRFSKPAGSRPDALRDRRRAVAGGLRRSRTRPSGERPVLELVTRRVQAELRGGGSSTCTHRGARRPLRRRARARVSDVGSPRGGRGGARRTCPVVGGGVRPLPPRGGRLRRRPAAVAAQRRRRASRPP